MSDYEFFNRMINKIDKDYGYDIANEFQRLFIKKENESIELQNKIDKALKMVSNEKYLYIERLEKIKDILGDKE